MCHNSFFIEGRAFGSPLARGLYPRASTAEADPRPKPGAPDDLVDSVVKDDLVDSVVRDDLVVADVADVAVIADGLRLEVS